MVLSKMSSKKLRKAKNFVEIFMHYFCTMGQAKSAYELSSSSGWIVSIAAKK